MERHDDESENWVSGEVLFPSAKVGSCEAVKVCWGFILLSLGWH
jgi:hypothetical protein